MRPSVYLTDGKLDRDRIGSVHIRELVGSAYDAYPLCEVIFEGPDLKSANLKKVSCSADYKKNTLYLSKDLNHSYALSETAENWIKLRVGMSQKDVIARIGYPPRQEINTALGSVTYYYSNGRVGFSKRTLKLISWQLF